MRRRIPDVQPVGGHVRLTTGRLFSDFMASLSAVRMAPLHAVLMGVIVVVVVLNGVMLSTIMLSTTADAAPAAAAAAAQDSSEDYQDPPYVRPAPFKQCDLGELDKFLPNNIRACAVDAATGSMPVSLLQQSLAMCCMMFKKCTIFMKKGVPMAEDNEHHCLHGIMTQARKTDVAGEAINLLKNIIAAPGYSREKVLSALERVHDCVDKAGFYLPLHKHQLVKLVSFQFQLLE